MLGVLNSCHGHAGHFPALRSATSAFLRTLLAVLILEPGALGSAGVADVSAETTNLLDVAAAPGHPPGSFYTDVCAVPEQLNATGAGSRIRLLEASGSTVLAFCGTPMTGVDAGLILFVHCGHLLLFGSHE